MKPNHSYSFLSTCHIPGIMLLHMSSAPQENHMRQSRSELTLHTPPKCQVPGSMSSLSELSHYIFTTILQNNYYNPSFGDEETESQIPKL